MALLALAAGVLVNSVSAQDTTVTLDLTGGSKYIFRGLELGDDTLHPSIEFGFGDTYAGIWGAAPLENKGWPEFFEDEIDFYVGHSAALNESTTLEVLVTHFTYEDADSTTEFSAGLAHELEGGATVSGFLHRDVDLDTLTFEGAAGYSFALSESSSLDVAFYVGTVSADTDDDYTYYGADAVIPFEVSENSTVSVGLHFADHDLEGAEDSHFYGSLSWTVGF